MNNKKKCPKAVKDLKYLRISYKGYSEKIFTDYLRTKDIHVVRKMIVSPTKGDNFWECESRLYKIDTGVGAPLARVRYNKRLT